MKPEQTQTKNDLARIRDIIEQRIYEVKTELPKFTIDRCWSCLFLNLLLGLTHVARRLV